MKVAGVVNGETELRWCFGRPLTEDHQLEPRRARVIAQVLQGAEEQIEALAPARVSDILTMVPGVRLSGTGTGLSRTISMGRALPGAGGGACPVEIFVDGVRTSRSRTSDPDGIPIDDLVNLSDLEGLEIYRGLAGVPAEFFTPDARCGVIAIWTRRGG